MGYQKELFFAMGVPETLFGRDDHENESAARAEAVPEGTQPLRLGRSDGSRTLLMVQPP
jgi:hypothetical protein